MNKRELLRHIGSVEQIGGIRDVTYNDGRAKGVRAIEVSTGDLTFTVLPDRCMDIAQASFKGKAFSWISKTGVVAPQYYEKDGKTDPSDDHVSDHGNVCPCDGGLQTVLSQNDHTAEQLRRRMVEPVYAAGQEQCADLGQYFREQSVDLYQQRSAVCSAECIFGTEGISGHTHCR